MLLIADLKSDIYREFGYIATIEPEIPAEQSQQNRIREIVQRKIKEIDEKLNVADTTRINEGVTGPQAVLYITIPFAYSRQEKELYQEIQKRLTGEAFSYTVKLMAGRSRKRRN